MTATWWIRLLRIAFAALGISALVYQAMLGDPDTGFTLANFFSYFTVLSNVFAAIVLLVGGLLAPGTPAWEWLRGAATTCMVITGIVYALLLQNIDVDLTDAWVNDVLHRFMPLVMLVDWIAVRARRLPERAWLTWLAIPFVYGVYTLIRGPFVDWYPYPFIDPRGQGYVSMTISLVVVFVGMTFMSAGVYWAGTRGRRPGQVEPERPDPERPDPERPDPERV
ncbi:Pr6Pr family membrane protein [Gordonia sp. NPDC058843]|uniref:Pr6Pr family membrane protein n=1 Tax=Gordonia sp. NPDC058843 TaxID=3346648 RepID=UPI0036841E35